MSLKTVKEILDWNAFIWEAEYCDLQCCNVSAGEKKIMADLILIGLNNNEQYISAVSANYRHLQVGMSGSRQAKNKVNGSAQALHSIDDIQNAQHVDIVCTCFSSRHCEARRHLRLDIFFERI